MEFKGIKLEQVKNALQYSVLYAKTESETAEFGLLLLDVQSEINKEAEHEKHIKSLKSLDKCPFHYCDSNPKCESNCRHAS